MIAELFKLAGARARGPRHARIAALAGIALALAAPGFAQDADTAHAAAKPRGNAVTQWNAVATDAFKPTQGTNPMGQSRTLAIVHRYESYTPGLADARGASVDAAVAAAAHDVLVAQVPDQAAQVEEAYARA